MAFRSNPFLERMSERTTSDHDFARLFSPKILEKLRDDALTGGLHIFRSAPGGGKTTLLRAFSPLALRAFWNSRHHGELSESFQRMVALGVLDEEHGPKILGVLLSCAAGYADLPPGADIQTDGVFRALMDCRVVLRTLRSAGAFLGIHTSEQFGKLRLDYADQADFQRIPRLDSGEELAAWAEKYEQRVYAELDSFAGRYESSMPSHVRFESLGWLQAIRFRYDGQSFAPKPLLMIDDLHKLRRKQRALLIEEITILRPNSPVWLAERSSAIGEHLLSQGAREGRDLRDYNIEEMWGGTKGPGHFLSFAQNILDRRMLNQDIINSASFSQYLRGEHILDDVKSEIRRGIESFREDVKRHKSNVRYDAWLQAAESLTKEPNVQNLISLYVTRILLARDENKRQMSLELTLPVEEMDDKDSSQVRGAAEIFAHEWSKVPYYFGFARVCAMATNNVEELLSLAAALFEGLQAKQILRKRELVLTPVEQEKILTEAARRKYEFIPKNHTEGLRAQRLLDAAGLYCRSKTFSPNAPYAPGVTGIRLSNYELMVLHDNSKSIDEQRSRLRRVLAECTAENLLVVRQSSASNSRESGTIFYLNRTLCAHYGLPLQMGGWQDVSMASLIDWMERGFEPSHRRRFGIG